MNQQTEGDRSQRLQDVAAGRERTAGRGAVPPAHVPMQREEGPVSKWVVTRGSWFLSQTPSGSQTLNKNGVGRIAQAVEMFQNPMEKALLTEGLSKAG